MLTGVGRISRRLPLLEVAQQMPETEALLQRASGWQRLQPRSSESPLLQKRTRNR